MHLPALLALLIAAVGSLSAAAHAQATAPVEPVAPVAPPEPAGLRIDERRTEQPFTVNVFGRPVQLSGNWDYSDKQRRNFDLNSANARDRRVRFRSRKGE